MQTAVEMGQESQLSGDDNGWTVESTPTVFVDERLDSVQMYLRSYEIYANETTVANPQVGTIGDETRSNKKLDPVEMYWRSREIYENESIAADTEDTPVVDTSVENLVDDSIVGDVGAIWKEAPEFSVETCPRDCVSENW